MAIVDYQTLMQFIGNFYSEPGNWSTSTYGKTIGTDTTKVLRTGGKPRTRVTGWEDI